jgi:glycosyltransferase involved in cell wall biosynthesis
MTYTGGVWSRDPSSLTSVRPLVVDVVIPALNEEDSIGLVLADIPDRLVRNVFVVDNGSDDATASVASAHGATVVPEPRRGYGSACLAGLERVSQDPPDVVLFLDADYSDHPEEIARLLEPIALDAVDMVIGSRTIGQREPGALLPQALFGNKLACILIEGLYGYRFTDLGPFRAVTWEALERIGMEDTNFGWTVEMQIKAAYKKLSCVEVPVSYRQRVGVSKITGTLSGTFRAGYKILFTIFSYYIKIQQAERAERHP